MSIEEWWSAPLEEEVWQVLLEQGEIAAESVPPLEPAEVLRTICGEPAPSPAEAEPVEMPDTSEAWEQAQASLESRERFGVQVVGYNRGGLLVEWNHLQGFVPASHLVDMPRSLAPSSRMAELSGRVGQSLTLQIIEVDRAQNRLVFSERLAQGPQPAAGILLRSLRPGDVRSGRITNLTSFGAFVDLGGVEGLIHISEISWQRVGHPSEVLELGQEVQVYVIDLDPDQGRIGLSLKRLQPDPWLDVEKRYQEGDIVEGRITNVVSFGAFARLEEGLEGLIHLSELAEGEFFHPRNIVREGDLVRVRVLNVDARQRRLGLSLRRAAGSPEAGGDGREPQA